ncbi:MAG: phage replisome organizer N-terminal domain-containing protein [Erysipelotrichaceae bacterium]|nr:phage replisome organizer N-terminal domain-containing protein [Erysipelotrichaceae bacterium]
MAAEDTKKYYWLKLYSDFFTSKRIKKLRKLAGGDTYTIIYLKMQLLALGANGYIAYDGLEKSLASELALDIDEKEDDVQVVINFLLQFGLMEQIDESTYLLPFVVECTGSETGKAIRLREARSRKQIETRHQYGIYKNILLTDSEYEILKSEFPYDYEKRIDNCSSYCASTGRTYKNYLATIRNWARKDSNVREEDRLPVYDTSKNKSISEEEKQELFALMGRDENGYKTDK